MAWMHFSLHGQQYQSSQLLIHWSVRLVVPHTEHLGLSWLFNFKRAVVISLSRGVSLHVEGPWPSEV